MVTVTATETAEKGGVRAMATATAAMAARAMTTMVASDKECDDDGGKSNGDGNEGGG